MKSTVEPAAPPRAALLARQSAGDLYGFLNSAEAHLAASPEDRELRAVAVHGFAQLGLISAAHRLAHADPALARDAAALPRTAEQRIAWSALAPQFEENLKLLAADHASVAAIQDVWRASAARLALFRTRDGNFQIYSRLRDAPGWLPALAPHQSYRLAESEKRQWRECLYRPAAVVGLGLGHVAREVIDATRQTFMEAVGWVYLVEPSWLAWAVVLHLHDWRAYLDRPGVRCFSGSDALARFEAEFAETDRALPQRLTSGSAWPGSASDAAVAEVLERQAARRSSAQADVFARVRARYAGRDQAFWAQRFAAAGRTQPPLRVLGITSLFTTVLQYSMRDWLAAFAAAGCQTRVLAERDKGHHFCLVRLAEEIERFEPDLLVQIDHLRAELPRCIPDELPSVSWIQDQLAHLFRAEAGARVGALEYVIGHGFPELLLDCGYPHDRFLPAIIPTCPRRLASVDETDADLAPYRCDVMYASNYAGEAAEVFERLSALLGPAAAPLVAAVQAELEATVRQPWFCGDYDFGRLLQRAEAQVRLQVRADGARREFVGALRTAADRLLREQMVDTAAEWAARTGRRMHLYGRGWERHPRWSALARGFLAPGLELGRAFRGAAISLHAGCNPALHQRVLDGLCAGGFFLIRERPFDTTHALTCAIHAEYVRRGRPPAPIHVRPNDLPEPHATAYRRALRLRGRDPEAGDVNSVYDLMNLQAHVERDWLPTASSVWSEFARVTFGTSAELAERLEYFVAHADERSVLAAKMRARVLERFTYDALVTRLLTWLTAALAAPDAARTPR